VSVSSADRLSSVCLGCSRATRERSSQAGSWIGVHERPDVRSRRRYLAPLDIGAAGGCRQFAVSVPFYVGF